MNNQLSNKIKVLTASLVIIIILLLAVIIIITKENNSNITTEPEDIEKTEEKATEKPTELPQLGIELFEIETPYTKLYYPLKWQNNIRTEIEEGNVYKVHFYGILENREEQLLFTIGFNDPEGYMIGNLTTNDGAIINVTIESYDLSTDYWSEIEQHTIGEMQEDVNYIIQELIKNPSFELVV